MKLLRSSFFDLPKDFNCIPHDLPVAKFSIYSFDKNNSFLL